MLLDSIFCSVSEQHFVEYAAKPEIDGILKIAAQPRDSQREKMETRRN
jgi:hypothetical protein